MSSSAKAVLRKKISSVLYEESKVKKFSLPDLLTLSNGEKITSAKTWIQERRPEILNLFEKYVYGKAPVEKPVGLRWEILSREKIYNNIIIKNVRIFLGNKKISPKINLKIAVPLKSGKPYPAFLVPGWANNKKLVLDRGYGFIHFDPREVQPDRKETVCDNSIRQMFSENKNESSFNRWGAIAVWAWSLSRVMDYLETDEDVDPDRICIMGLSRFGKAVMWAGALDKRFAIVFSCESGCGGAVIVRRKFGETVKAINENFPHWFNGNFKKYNDRVNKLPVDWHMLIALIAPRPVYIAAAEDDLWGDPVGSFLAAKYAEPVYTLFHRKGLGMEKMPPVEMPVGSFIGYHVRKGGHNLKKYDWIQFLNFADRHFGLIKK